MPIIHSAIKRMKQTLKRRTRNVGIKRDVKTATKAFVAKPTAAALSKAHSEIDTAVKKKLIKPGTAARRKSNLAKAAKAAGVTLTKTAKKATVKPTAKAAPKKTATKATKTTTTKKVPAKKPTTKKS